MNRAEVLNALNALGDRLDAVGVVGDVYVVAGLAVVFAYSALPSLDEETVYAPKWDVFAAAAQVREDLGLTPGWLDHLSEGLGPASTMTEVLELPALRVEISPPEPVLVLKALAHRVGEDEDDVRLLAALCGLDDADQVIEVVGRLAGRELVTAQIREFVESAMASGPDLRHLTEEPPPR